MYASLNGSAHPRAAREIAVAAMPEDERVWVPQAEGVWFRPLMLNTMQGQWCNLLRVRRSGVLSRHLHPNPVHGYVIRVENRSETEFRLDPSRFAGLALLLVGARELVLAPGASTLLYAVFGKTP